MIYSAEVSYEEVHIQYPLGACALNPEACLSLSLCDLMRPLNKSYDLSVSNAKHSRSTCVLHYTQMTLDLSHFKELATIHSQSARVVIVSQI
jgi:hypothetical protein